jgi:hypothetical protein
MNSSWKSRGVLGVLAKLFLWGYLGLSENLGGLLFLPFLCFIAFLSNNFSELTPGPQANFKRLVNETQNKGPPW